MTDDATPEDQARTELSKILGVEIPAMQNAVIHGIMSTTPVIDGMERQCPTCGHVGPTWKFRVVRKARATA